MKHFNRYAAIFLSVLLLLVVTLVPVFANSDRSAESSGQETPSTKDGHYTSIPIWGETIPGNSDRSKFDDMKIDFDATLENDLKKSLIAMSKYTGAVYIDCQEEIDTLTWLKDIKPGISAETYTDVPAIVPFPVEGSDRAVIIIPGGGYVYTGDITEPNTAETDLLAKQFNERGISAFVLGYRCNPYKMPIPLLDMQRAVRWLRFHSEDYGFDPDKIALFGGSAGGYLAAGFLNLLQGKNQFPEDYTPDEIDMVSDEVSSIGLFYPALTLKYNHGCGFAVFPADEYRNPITRANLLYQYDLPSHITNTTVPQYIAHGTEDMLVTHLGSKEYASRLEAKGGDVVYTEVEGANHIFTSNPDYAWVFEEYLDWLEAHF
ncbi:MAG: alpha/beta hydrolase [Clostridia bacterium]|nr:alpha/beta hydrolase [Clostridia bacterium]